MSITDELRKWGRATLADTSLLVRMEAIADRIDAVHEGELLETGNNILRDVSREWVRLPKDADGVPIHVGDVMEPNGANSLFGQASFEVRAMRYDEGGWEVYDRLGDRYAPSLLRHHHAPTVEDVLTEFGIDWEHESDCEDRAALLKEYASKLRLAKEDA